MYVCVHVSMFAWLVGNYQVCNAYVHMHLFMCEYMHLCSYVSIYVMHSCIYECIYGCIYA